MTIARALLILGMNRQPAPNPRFDGRCAIVSIRNALVERRSLLEKYEEMNSSPLYENWGGKKIYSFDVSGF